MDQEEDTYSAIFRALRHPIRRRILRMLGGRRMTYTEVLRELGVENGLLNYHLESLRQLVVKGEGDRYGVSAYGEAALALYDRVEAEAPRRPEVNAGVAGYAVIVALILVSAALGGLYLGQLNENSRLRSVPTSIGASYATAGLEPLMANMTAWSSPYVELGSFVDLDNYSQHQGYGGTYHEKRRACVYCPGDGATLRLSVFPMSRLTPGSTVYVSEGRASGGGGVVFSSSLESGLLDVPLSGGGWYTVYIYTPPNIVTGQNLAVAVPWDVRMWIEGDGEALVFGYYYW